MVHAVFTFRTTVLDMLHVNVLCVLCVLPWHLWSSTMKNPFPHFLTHLPLSSMLSLFLQCVQTSG